MPLPGIITIAQYTSTQRLDLPSPAIWGLCPTVDLNAEFKGYFVYSNFEAGDAPYVFTVFTDIASSTASTSTGMPLQYVNNTSTLGIDHIVALVSGSTVSTSHTGIATRPLGPITPGGLGVWFETALTPSTILASGQAQSFFAGLVTAAEMNISSGSTFYAYSSGSTGGGVIPGVVYGIGVGPIVSTGSTASSNVLRSTGSLVGFWSHGDAPNNCDAVYQSSTGVLTTVLANVMTASTATGNPAFLQALPNGSASTFGSTTCQKLGVQYLPNNGTLTWYVNGFPVCSAAVTAATIDVINSYGGVVEVGGSTNTLLVDFLAVAAQRVL